MNVIFKITASKYLPELPIVNGQLIILKDTEAMYYDINDSRHRVSLASGIATVLVDEYTTTIGIGNDPTPGDLLEVGNGEVFDSEGNLLPEDEQVRSNAFRVTQDGVAIAKNDVQTETGIKLSDREYIGNKVLEIGDDPTDAHYPSAKAVSDYVQDEINSIEIGGRNLLKNSTNMTFLAYFGSTVTTESNVSVPEWGATDAKRIYGTSGSGGFVAYNNIIKSISNVSYVNSIYIKNNHLTNNIILMNNLGSVETIVAGEQKRVILTAVGNGNVLQFQLGSEVETVGDEFDITYWHPKAEIGNVATDWSPAPEDPCICSTITTQDSGVVGSIWIE